MTAFPISAACDFDSSSHFRISLRVESEMLFLQIGSFFEMIWWKEIDDETAGKFTYSIVWIIFNAR